MPSRLANSTVPVRHSAGRDRSDASVIAAEIWDQAGKQARTRSGIGLISCCRTGAEQGGHTAHSWRETAPLLAQLLLLMCPRALSASTSGAQCSGVKKLAHCPTCTYGDHESSPPFFTTLMKSSSGKCRDAVSAFSLSEIKFRSCSVVVTTCKNCKIAVKYP